MRIYKEITNDLYHGEHLCGASDNQATYILSSALALDAHSEYVARYQRIPPAAWYNRHFSFERIK